MRAALLCLALAACGVPQPSNVEVDPPPGADDAAEIVVQEWSERLGVDLAVDDLPPIRWFEGTCLDYGDHCRADGGYVFALWSDPEIHLVLRSSIHASALAHETLHWALDVAVGDSDGDHARMEWVAVEDLEATLVRAGL